MENVMHNSTSEEKNIYLCAEGEDGNEDNTDYETEDGVAEDMPKYRALVKAKKLEYKAKYGKWRIVKLKVIRGWRFYWKNNKTSERAKLKLLSKKAVAATAINSPYAPPIVKTNTDNSFVDTNMVTSTLNADTSIMPFYKKTWFMIAAPIALVGLGIGGYFMLKK